MGLESEIIFFPGNIFEYEKFCGYEVEIIDTKKRDKGVIFQCLSDKEKNFHIKDITLRNYLLENKIEAIVSATFGFDRTRKGNWAGSYTSTFEWYYGIPIRKKLNRK